MPEVPLDGLVSVTVEPATETVYDDSYVQFVAIGHYEDDTTRPITDYIDRAFLVWTSSNPSVASVIIAGTFGGRCYGVAPGTTTITVDAGVHGGVDVEGTAALTVEAHPAYTAPENRFSLGFGFPTMDPYPTWTAIDAHPNLVTSYSIDRGRSYEMDQTDAGRATVTITDPDGILDPTNPAGPYYGQIRPLLHAVLCRRNPVTDTWEERYRGFVEDYSYEIDPSQRLNRLVIGLTDIFELVSTAEMQPGQFGVEVNGQVFYSVKRPEERIAAILAETGIPRRMTALLPGTVLLHSTTYSGGESPLSAIQEAADGEFPALANVFTDRHGRLCFHGRNARFDPSGTAAAAGEAWDYHEWKAGDSTAASAGDTAQVRALSFQRGTSRIINSASALPMGLPDSNVASQRKVDTVSVNTYGTRSWSASNLLTLSGIDPDGSHRCGSRTETRRFANYYVQNYAQPKDRITEIAFRSINPTDPRAAATWDLLTRVDIGDTVEVTVAAAGGGGFASELYFVEGVHEDVRPLAPGYDDVTLTLDLSPRTYYTFNPWEDVSDPDADLVDPDGMSEDNPVMRSGKPKPTTHSRDHEHDGADPIRLHYEKVGTEAGEGSGGGDGSGLGAYAAGTDWQMLEVMPGTFEYLNWTEDPEDSTHSSGVTISGTTITILTAGVYEIIAAGFVSIGSGQMRADMVLEIDGSSFDPAWTRTVVPVAIPYPADTDVHVASMSLLDHAALSSGSVLKFAAYNNGTYAAAFERWRAVVKQLA